MIEVLWCVPFLMMQRIPLLDTYVCSLSVISVANSALILLRISPTVNFLEDGLSIINLLSKFCLLGSKHTQIINKFYNVHATVILSLLKATAKISVLLKLS